MKNIILVSSLLGLILSGCNHATRSSTGAYSTSDSSTVAPTMPTIDQNAPASRASDATYTPSAQLADTSTAGTGVTSPVVVAAAAPSSSAYPSSSPSSIAATGSSTSSAHPSADASASAAATGVSAGTPLLSSPNTNGIGRSSTDTALPGTNPAYTSDASRNSSPTATSDNAALSTSSAATHAGSADISGQITAWHLAGSDIQSDLDGSTMIVRSKDSAVGAPAGTTDDTVLSTMVKGTLQADTQLSAIASQIQVEAHNGEVTLHGTAQSADQIGRAMALALNANGATKVSSDLKVQSSNSKSNEK